MQARALCAIALLAANGCSGSGSSGSPAGRDAAAPPGAAATEPRDAAAVAARSADAAAAVAVAAPPASDAAPSLPAGVVELELPRLLNTGLLYDQTVRVRMRPPPGWTSDRWEDTSFHHWEPVPPVHPTSLSISIGPDWQERSTLDELMAAGVASSREQAGMGAKVLDEQIAELRGGAIATWVIDAEATRNIRHGQTICLYGEEGEQWIVRIHADYPDGDTATAAAIRQVCESVEVFGLSPTEAERRPPVVIDAEGDNLSTLPATAYTVDVERLPFWVSMTLAQPLVVNGIAVSPNWIVVKDGDGRLQEFFLSAPHAFPTPLEGIAATCAADEHVELYRGVLVSCTLDSALTIEKREYPRWSKLSFFNGKLQPPPNKKKTKTKKK
jgi:hypothetical protein